MSLFKRVFTFTMLLFLLLVAQGFNRSAVNASGASIQGFVRDAAGDGIGGVQVLSDNGAPDFAGVRITTTNPDGSFNLKDVQSGANHLRAFLDGLAAAHYWNVYVEAGQTYPGVEFILRPGGGSISGWVSDSDGQGVADVVVNVLEYTDLGFNNGAWSTIETDAEGNFKTNPNLTGGLPTGRYLVMAMSSVVARQENVLVTEDQDTPGIHLLLQSSSGSISGRILDVDRQVPLSGATIFADNGVLQATGNSNEQGEYSLHGLSTSGYNVVVTTPGYANAHSYNISVTDGYETAGVDFPLTRRMGKISGRIQTLDGKPLVGIYLLADSNVGNGYGSTVSDENGYYQIDNLAPMVYVVHASHPGYANLSREVLVQEGKTSQNIDFEMSTASGGISGKVSKDGQPVPLANIYVNSRSDDLYSFDGNAVTDEQGNYVINHLPPGQYDVHVAAVPGYVNQVRYEVVVEDEVVPGIDFKIVNGNSFIDGYVKDITGNPIPGAMIHLFQLSNPGTWATITTDHDGYYAVGILWAGDYHVYAAHSDFEQVVKPYVQLSGDVPTQVDIILGQEWNRIYFPLVGEGR